MRLKTLNELAVNRAMVYFLRSRYTPFTAGIKRHPRRILWLKKIQACEQGKAMSLPENWGLLIFPLALCIFSAINVNRRLIAAIISAIFFGLAALQHLLKRLNSLNKMVAMPYNLIVFTFCLVFILFSD